MAVALTAAGLALRRGLLLRRARRTGATGRRELLRLHLRIAKPAVALVVLGFVLGPFSMFWLRGRAPFTSLHALLGITAAGLFVAAAFVGRRRERGQGGSADAHALLGIAAFLVGAAAAVAGFVLLP